MCTFIMALLFIFFMVISVVQKHHLIQSHSIGEQHGFFEEVNVQCGWKIKERRAWVKWKC